MNIAIFTDTYFPQVSGVATSIQTLKEAFEDNGHQVYIFTTSDPKAEIEDHVFRYESVPFLFFKDRRVAIPSFASIYRKCKELAIDIVHTQTEFSMGLMGVSVARYMRIPLVHTYHTWYEKYLHYILNGKLISRKTVVHLSKLFCNQADLVISPSEQMKDVLRDYQIQKPIHVLATGVKLPKEIDQDVLINFRQSWGIAQDEYLLLSINRIAEEKNLNAIIEQFPQVLADIPNAKLLLAGDGPQLEALKALTAKLNLTDKIIFPGFVSHDQVNVLYQAADVYVNLSTSETQGLTFIEAITNHLPVIAMKTPYLAALEDIAPFGHLLTEVTDFPKSVKAIETAQSSLTEGLAPLIYHVSADAFYVDLYHIYQYMIELQSEKPRNLIGRSVYLSSSFAELHRPLKWTSKYFPSFYIRRKDE
ncbi:glycosyltransferase [Aerococcus sp. NPDC058936]|uniref:glycosyltransferase n=1 Tax=Aerococcus sp. NPDC058936 TaxID=3346674 RepID=UPI0036711EE8